MKDDKSRCVVSGWIESHCSKRTGGFVFAWQQVIHSSPYILSEATISLTKETALGR
jgi:hypothetical protein